MSGVARGRRILDLFILSHGVAVTRLPHVTKYKSSRMKGCIGFEQFPVCDRSGVKVRNKICVTDASTDIVDS